MDPGEAAQAVEVSAYPDRYRNYAPVADSILTALTTGGGAARRRGRSRRSCPRGWCSRSRGHLGADLAVRDAHHPITGERKLHTGTDFAAPDGTPILAAADGTVTVAEFSGGYGGLIVIEHTIDGQTVATAYAHMWQHGIHVRPATA
jgi:murein DD-endopeptidase MepM/ murein hydrolase activator NlpD